MEETRAQASGSARKGKAPAIARNVNDSPATSEPLQALETAMAVLTKQLEAAMGSVPLNVLAVAEAAEAIGKTARAISDVRALQ